MITQNGFLLDRNFSSLMHFIGFTKLVLGNLGFLTRIRPNYRHSHHDAKSITQEIKF